MSHVAHVAEATVRWYILEVCDRPIGRFVPGVVPLLPLPGRTSTNKFWSAQRHSRAGRFPPAPRPAASSQAAIADQSAVDEVAQAPESGEEMVEAAADEEECDDWFSRDLEGLLGEFGEEGFQGLPEPDERATDGAVAAGAAASSGGEVEPPVAPAEQAQCRAQSPARRKGAELTYYVPGGSISFYRSKSSFEAVCECKSHKRCVLTRTHRARVATPAGAPQVGGRTGRFSGRLVGKRRGMRRQARTLATRDVLVCARAAVALEEHDCLHS